MDHCAFDQLLRKNVPHIMEKIFFSLDYKSFMSCHMVCTTWNKLLKSEYYVQKSRKMLAENMIKLTDAIAKGDADKVRKIIQRGMVDMNHDSGNFYTTLFGSPPASSKTEILKFLLQGGANPNVVIDGGGNTPLYCAVLAGQKDMVELLMDHGASPQRVIPRLSYIRYSMDSDEKEAFQVILDRNPPPSPRRQKRINTQIAKFRKKHRKFYLKGWERTG